MTVIGLTDDRHPRTYSETETESDALLREPALPARDRDELFDALASVTGADPKELTKNAARACGVALAQIKGVAPGLTAEEIKRRAENYRLHMPTASITPSALANHWATCAKEPSRSQVKKPDRINFKTDDYSGFST